MMTWVLSDARNRADESAGVRGEARRRSSCGAFALQAATRARFLSLLLGPSTMERSWNAGSIFPGMAAPLDREARMTTGEVQGLLARLIEARPRLS
jgi:hypothetical protein